MVIANIMTCLYIVRFESCTAARSFSICQLDGLCPRNPGMKVGTMEVCLKHTEDMGSRSKWSLEAFPVEAPMCTSLPDQCSAFRYLINKHKDPDSTLTGILERDSRLCVQLFPVWFAMLLANMYYFSARHGFHLIGSM